MNITHFCLKKLAVVEEFYELAKPPFDAAIAEGERDFEQWAQRHHEEWDTEPPVALVDKYEKARACKTFSVKPVSAPSTKY